MNFQSINIRLNKRLTILLILICFSCKLQAQSKETQTYRNLTEALQNPKDVRILNLNGSKLATLSKEIGKLQNLQVLNLGFNQLTTLPQEIGQQQKLRKLNLYNNPIASEKIERIRKLLPKCIIYFE
ncbi:leucine rich repeat protein [Leptospira noguchii str. 1993005606]|uniref:Leucine rich repeat protein n=1 Tax=Leptospira noguchii str. 2007001578 TaxID=1049974 RepID=A0ABN0J5S9_9LEPT|nr:leucine-rich repeat domain-containing protein [Leptospira noguchii]EMN02337.1 leucine rich repeat protein [Leptospira noguchii str. 2007001578]EPE84298.1 leucine rich repeat protein [Leptospira noguchii str. 1993005606]